MFEAETVTLAVPVNERVSTSFNGRPVDIDPLAAMMNPAAFAQTLHMTLPKYF
jgi:cytochrome bd-type quinol oxidase subunit 1